MRTNTDAPIPIPVSGIAPITGHKYSYSYSIICHRYHDFDTTLWQLSAVYSSEESSQQCGNKKIWEEGQRLPLRIWVHESTRYQYWWVPKCTLLSLLKSGIGDFIFSVSVLFAGRWRCSVPHQSRPTPAQTRPPVIQMRRELSQCFLSDCRALRFHLWSKLRASVPGCHTNSPFHSPLSSRCPPPSQPVTTPSVQKHKEYQTHSC